MATASREFQVFVKPIASVCNLDCRYCYYLEKRDLYPGAKSFHLPDDLLEQYIVQHIEACPIPVVLFSWHGGEPTLLGLEWFRRVVALQRKHRTPGRQIINGVQTNGTLLDEEWCRFLADEGFYVGLSLDGPEELHDGYRFTRTKKPTYERVMNAFQLLKRYRASCDILCVVHDRNVARPLEVYRFLKEIGATQLVFLPLVRRTKNGGMTPESVPPEAFGEFLCAVFDEWVRNDIGRIYVNWFDEATRPARGIEHSLCILRKTCGELPVLEHNGDFYSCDHFVDREHYLGNLRDRSLLDILESPAQKEFGQRKWDTLPRGCRECKVLEYCNGGCPKDRIVAANGGEKLNYLCPGLNRFFTHVQPYARRLAWFTKSGQPLEGFKDFVRAEDENAPAPPGRNDPCPCGSGKKYKRCCMGRTAFTPQVHSH